MLFPVWPCVAVFGRIWRYPRFLFNDFANQQIKTKDIEEIINEAMIYALDFDLQAPSFNAVKVVSVHEILDINNNQKLKTAKRMGYKFSSETNNG